MAGISSNDQFILKKLVSAGRLDLDKVEELMQLLEVHRAKDPSTSVTDLLVRRKLVSPSEVNKLLWEAENSRSTAPVAGKGTPGTGAKAPGPKPAAPRPRSVRRTEDGEPVERVSDRVQTGTPVGLIVIGIIFTICLGGVAGYMYLENQKKNQEIADSSTNSRTEPAEPVTPEPGEDDDPGDKASPTVLRFQRDMKAALAKSNLDDRLSELAYLAETCSIEALRQEILEHYTTELAKADALARKAIDDVTPTIAQLKRQDRLPEAIEEMEKLYTRFGSKVLDGELITKLNDLKKERSDTFRHEFKDAKERFFKGQIELARRTLIRIKPLAETDDERSEIDRWLAKIKETDTSDDPLLTPEEIAEVEARAKEKKPEPDPAEVDGEEDEGTEEAEVVQLSPEQKRIAVVAGRLKELFACEKASLDPDGNLTITYQFSELNHQDSLDWSPPVPLEPDSRNKLRWSFEREWQDGIRISDDGTFIHKAPLLAPVKIEMKFFNETSFNPKNTLCLAWVNKKGRGVGGVYGRQSCELSKFRVGKRSPRTLPALVSEKSYTVNLEITEETFKTWSGGHRPDPRDLPKKLESGHIAIVWNNYIAVTVEKVTVTGKLDLEWAEEQLKIN